MEPVERWLPDGIAVLSVDDARAEPIGCWLRAFGPGTLDDLRWWTGWAAGVARKALATVAAVEVALDGGEIGYVLLGAADDRALRAARGRVVEFVEDGRLYAAQSCGGAVAR